MSYQEWLDNVFGPMVAMGLLRFGQRFAYNTQAGTVYLNGTVFEAALLVRWAGGDEQAAVNAIPMDDRDLVRHYRLDFSNPYQFEMSVIREII